MTLGAVTVDNPVVWRAGSFEVELLPRLGAAVAALRWTGPDGLAHDLLRPADDAARAGNDPASLSMFLMAPFCNRIDGGRFRFGGQTVTLPQNRAHEDMTIHGFVWDRAWVVERATDEDLVLSCERDDGPDPYRFRAELAITTDADAVTFTLKLESTTATLLPYGLGFHPYFPYAADMTLDVWAAGAFELGTRCLPESVSPSRALLGTGRAAALPDTAPLEIHFGHWDREAIMTWPSRALSVTLTASEPFKNLQIYVPPDRSACCVEPMSHLTDVVNRPAFAQWGYMETLGRGGTLTGAMTLRPQRIAQ
jgi:aldose 1-epimerase